MTQRCTKKDWHTHVRWFMGNSSATSMIPTLPPATGGTLSAWVKLDVIYLDMDETVHESQWIPSGDENDDIHAVHTHIWKVETRLLKGI